MEERKKKKKKTERDNPRAFGPDRTPQCNRRKWRLIESAASLSVRDFCFFFFSLSLSPTIPKFSQNKKKLEKKYRQKLPFPDRGFKRETLTGSNCFPRFNLSRRKCRWIKSKQKIKIKQKLTRRLESNEKWKHVRRWKWFRCVKGVPEIWFDTCDKNSRISSRPPNFFLFFLVFNPKQPKNSSVDVDCRLRKEWNDSIFDLSF